VLHPHAHCSTPLAMVCVASTLCTRNIRSSTVIQSSTTELGSAPSRMIRIGMAKYRVRLYVCGAYQDSRNRCSKIRTIPVDS
jgi:hypothetical protein